jgi:hypothetical protein
MWQRQVGSRGHDERDGREDRHHQPTRSPSPVPTAGGGLTPAAVLAMQGSVGNAAVNRMLRANPASASLPVQRMYHGGYGGGYPPYQGAPQPPQPQRPEEVMQGIAGLVNNPPMVNYGARRQGRAHEEFWMRFPRSKQGEEAEETLSETSALLFDSMKGAQERAREEEPDRAAEDTNNREVQGMLINDRLVFASNFNSSIDTLVDRGRRADGSDPTLRELLLFEQSNEGRTQGLRGHEAENLLEKLASFRRKNQAIVTGQRGEGEQGRGEDATAMALREKVNAPVIVVDIEDPNLHEMLTSREHEGRVFLLRFAALDPRTITQGKNRGRQTGEESIHAEQKLLLALQHAHIRPRRDVRGPLAIMGKYRPCMGCAAALMYYRERLGFENLSFDENYGHYFQGSVNSLYEHQRHIMDEHYLENIRQMVRDDITSTPAMANEAAPAEAVHRRGGRALRVPGRYASRQADVTPPTSDAEFDGRGTYKRVGRQLEDTWTTETAHVGIGQGSQTHRVPRRKHERLTEDQAKELKELWNGTRDRAPTNESRQRAIELAFHYNRRERMTIDYLSNIVEMAANRFGGYLVRYEREGHWQHVPSRSNKIESQPKSKKKGAPGKQFTKGGELDEDGKDTIKAVIRSLAGNPWCANWERIHSGAATGELNATQAPDELLRTLAELRRDHGYDVPSMSRYLHTGNNGDKLRKAITRKGEKLLANREASSAPGNTDDVEMGGAPAYPGAPATYPAGSSSGARGGYPGPGYPAGGQGTMPSFGQMTTAPPTRPGPSYYGGGGESSSAGSAYQSGPPQIPGYALRINPGTRQPYYIDEESGFHYVHIDGRMVRVYGEEDVEMSGTRGYY